MKPSLVLIAILTISLLFLSAASTQAQEPTCAFQVFGEGTIACVYELVGPATYYTDCYWCYIYDHQTNTLIPNELQFSGYREFRIQASGQYRIEVEYEFTYSSVVGRNMAGEPCSQSEIDGGFCTQFEEIIPRAGEASVQVLNSIRQPIAPTLYRSPETGEYVAINSDISAPPPEQNTSLVETRLDLAGTERWRSTGVFLYSGDVFEITAFGTVKTCTFEGICDFWGPSDGQILCEGGCLLEYYPFAFVAGRIGQGEPFAVGTGGTFRAQNDGELMLGVNDTVYNDNLGSFQIIIAAPANAPISTSTPRPTRTPAPTRTPTATVDAPAVLRIGTLGAIGYAQPARSGERTNLVNIMAAVIGKTSDDSWIQITYQDSVYWIELSAFVQVEGDLANVPVTGILPTDTAPTLTPTDVSTSTPVPNSTANTENQVTLRIGQLGAIAYSGPSRGSNRIGGISGVLAQVVGRDSASEWVQFAYEGELIWVELTSFQSIQGDLSSIPVVEEPVVSVASATALPEIVRQWASRASASSEYSNPAWSAEQATGSPDSPGCGDFRTAWASLTETGQDWLTVFYDQPVIPQQIRIFQNYEPGSIISVELLPADGGDPIVVPNSSDPVRTCPRVFQLSIELEGLVPINAVRINLDQRIGGSWNEIDAVELTGLIAD